MADFIPVYEHLLDKARGLPVLKRHQRCSVGKPAAHDCFAATHGVSDAYRPPTANADITIWKPWAKFGSERSLPPRLVRRGAVQDDPRRGYSGLIESGARHSPSTSS